MGRAQCLCVASKCVYRTGRTVQSRTKHMDFNGWSSETWKPGFPKSCCLVWRSMAIQQLSKRKVPGSLSSSNMDYALKVCHPHCVRSITQSCSIYIYIYIYYVIQGNMILESQVFTSLNSIHLSPCVLFLTVQFCRSGTHTSKLRTNTELFPSSL